MDIKINVEMLGCRPGDIVSEDDRYYDTFKQWAENKDRKGGSVICEFTKDKKADLAPPAGSTDEELATMRAKAVHNMKNNEIIMLLDLDHGIKSPEGAKQKELREVYKEALKVKEAPITPELRELMDKPAGELEEQEIITLLIGVHGINPKDSLNKGELLEELHLARGGDDAVGKSIPDANESTSEAAPATDDTESTEAGAEESTDDTASTKTGSEESGEG